jgi:integrase
VTGGSFGTVDKLPSGRFRARYRHNGQRFTGPVTFDIKAEAWDWLAEERAAISRREWTPPATRATDEGHTTTVVEYMRTALAARTLAPGTREDYARIIRLHIEPRWSGVALSSITPKVVKGWYAGLCPNHPTMRAHVYALFRSCLNDAVSDELIAANPCRVKGGGAARRAGKTVIAEGDELAAITKAMPPRLQLAVTLGGWAGLRYGEVIELRRGDFNLTRGTLTVERAARRVSNPDGVRAGAQTYAVGDPKAGSDGVVHLPEFVVELVAAHLREFVGQGANALVFPAFRDQSQRLPVSTFKRHYYRAREAAGRPDLRFHDLRHTAGTRFAVLGATPAETKEFLRHKTNAAAERYQHAARSRMAEMARRLNDAAAGM